MREIEHKKGPFRCPRCGTVTSGKLQYCSECGLPLNNECKECGATWRYYLGYTFCPSCGTRLKEII